jgi:WD40 repeat protein
MKTLLLLLPFFISVSILRAQQVQQDSIDRYVRLAQADFAREDFQSALEKLEIAQFFNGDKQAVEQWRDSCLTAYVPLLRAERDRAEREKRGSELAGLAYKTRRTDPTQAAWIAREALELNPTSYSAALQLNDIFAEEYTGFYEQHYRHGAQLTAVAVHPRTGHVATATFADTLRLWQGQELVAEHALKDVALDLIFHPLEEELWVAGAENSIAVYDLSLNLKRRYTGHFGDVAALQWSPDGERLASVSWDGYLRLWERSATEPVLSVPAHEHFVTAVAFSPDGKQLLTGDWEGQISLWSRTGELLWTTAAHTGPVSGVAFIRGGEEVLSTSWDRTLRTAAAQDGVTGVDSIRTEATVLTVAAYPDAEAVFLGDIKGNIELRSWSGEVLTSFLAHKQAVVDLQLVSHGSGSRLVSADVGGQAYVWSPRLFVAREQTIGLEPVWSLVAVAEDTWITGDATGKVIYWTAGGSDSLLLAEHDGSVYDLAYHPATGVVASTGQQGLVRLSTLTGDTLPNPPRHPFRSYGVTFSPAGDRIYFASWDGTARSFAVGDTVLSPTYADHESRLQALAVSPDGERLVTAAQDRALRIWRTADAEPLATLTGHTGRVLATDWSPDGRWIASGGEGGTVILWTAAGEPRRYLTGHTGSVAGVRFSATGDRLFTSDSDGKVMCWDTIGRLLQTFLGHAGTVYDVDVSATTQQPVSVGESGRLIVWRTAEQVFTQGRLAALAPADRVRLGLAPGTPPAAPPVAGTNHANYFIRAYQMGVLGPTRQGDYQRLLASAIAMKAFLSPDPAERQFLNAEAVAVMEDYWERVETFLRDNEMTAADLSASTWAYRGLLHSNAALLRLVAGDAAGAFHHDSLALAQQTDDEVRSLIEGRHAVLAYLSNGDEDALQAVISAEAEYSSRGAQLFLYMFTGMDSADAGLSTVREIIGHEVVRFRDSGWTHPRLPDLLTLLAVDP